MKLQISRIPTTEKLPHNLPPEERKALRELKCNHNLVINKTSTIVVQNKTNYIADALEHLNDPNTYRGLDGDPTNNICCGIKQLINNLYSKGLLSKKMVDFCSPPKSVRFAGLYFLKNT